VTHCWSLRSLNIAPRIIHPQKLFSLLHQLTGHTCTRSKLCTPMSSAGELPHPICYAACLRKIEILDTLRSITGASCDSTLPFSRVSSHGLVAAGQCGNGQENRPTLPGALAPHYSQLPMTPVATEMQPRQVEAPSCGVIASEVFAGDVGWPVPVLILFRAEFCSQACRRSGTRESLFR
jgi:hypothetical protein